MNPEVLRDLLDRHTGLPVTGNTHHVVTELARIRLGHSDTLPGHLSASHLRCHLSVQQTLPPVGLGVGAGTVRSSV
jgi:hypothetical protein